MEKVTYFLRVAQTILLFDEYTVSGALGEIARRCQIVRRLRIIPRVPVEPYDDDDQEPIAFRAYGLSLVGGCLPEHA